MKIDLVTRLCLVVIAICLSIIVARDFLPTRAEAGYEEVMKVDIVKLRGKSIYGGLKVNLVEVQGKNIYYDDLVVK